MKNTRTVEQHNRRSHQAGIGLGYLLIIIGLVIVVGILAMQFKGSSPTVSTDSQQTGGAAAGIKLDISKFSTAAEALYATHAAGTFQEFGRTAGGEIGITLTNGTVVASSEIAWPAGPAGKTAQLTYRTAMGPVGGGVLANRVIVFSNIDVPAATCSAFNTSLGLPAEVIDATLAADFSEIQSGSAYTVDSGVFVAATGAGNTVGGTACYIAAAGDPVGRVVSKIR